MKTRDGMKVKSIFGTMTAAALLILGGNATAAGENNVPGFAPWAFGGIESRQEMLRQEHEQVMEQLKHVKKEPASWRYGGAFAVGWAPSRGERHYQNIAEEYAQVNRGGSGGGIEIAAFEVVDGAAGLTGFRPWDTAKYR